MCASAASPGKMVKSSKHVNQLKIPEFSENDITDTSGAETNINIEKEKFFRRKTCNIAKPLSKVVFCGSWLGTLRIH